MGVRKRPLVSHTCGIGGSFVTAASATIVSVVAFYKFPFCK
jgi:hypothetical protein